MRRREAIALLAAPLWAGGGAATSAPGPVRRVCAWTSAEHLSGVRAKVEGKNVRVLRVKGPSEDLLLVIVLDVTGDLTLVDAARQATVAEIEKLPASVWTSIMRSQDGLRVLIDPTADRAAATAALTGATVSGRAGLLETIEPSAKLATTILRKTTVRAAVLYLTDSNIYNYREDYTNPVINMSDSSDLSRRFPDALIREKCAKLAGALAETDAPVFVVHLAFLRDRLNEAYQTGLQQMAEATGGQANFCRTLGDIPSTIEQVFQKIRSMWAIDFEVPGGCPRSFTIQLAAESADLQHRTRLVNGARGKE